MPTQNEKTNSLTNAIRQIIRMTPEAHAFRVNTMGVWDGKKYRPAPDVGLTDVQGCFKSVALYIEIKSPKDDLNPNQKLFKEAVLRAGGLHFVARDIESFVEWWNKVKEKLKKRKIIKI